MAIILNLEENYISKFYTDTTIVTVPVDPNKPFEVNMCDGYDRRESDVMIAKIERKTGFPNLRLIWPARADAAWERTAGITNFRGSTLLKLPYIQVYASGVITVTDTAICERIDHRDFEYPLVRAFVDVYLRSISEDLTSLNKTPAV